MFKAGFTRLEMKGVEQTNQLGSLAKAPCTVIPTLVHLHVKHVCIADSLADGMVLMVLE